MGQVLHRESREEEGLSCVSREEFIRKCFVWEEIPSAFQQREED